MSLLRAVTLLSFLAFGSLAASPPPSVIYVDFGGVMAQPDRQVQMDFLVDNLGFPREAIEDSPHFKWMQLHPDEIDYLKGKAAAHSIDLTEEMLREYSAAKKRSVRDIPGMCELVMRLREMHYEVNLITNIRGENFDVVKPFIPLFDSVVHCPVNPGERQLAWSAEEKRHNAQPEQLLLIDDQEANVEEAKKLGIQAIAFEDVDHLVQTLIEEKILKD